MAGTKKDDLERTRSLMGALVRMKPKPHEDMKIGKKKKAKAKKANRERTP